MESQELLEVLQALKSDSTVAERHDFETRLDKLTAIYKTQCKCLLHNRKVAITEDHWTGWMLLYFCQR